MTIPDSITKTVVLQAPRARVWEAIADSRKFGTWFGVEFEGPFEVGKPLAGTIVCTKVDPEIAATQLEYVGTRFDITVEAIEPRERLAFRWHPYAIEPDADYSEEPTTRVEFVLSDAPGDATRLTVTESGFDGVPLERRATAFEMNEGGWAVQVRLVAKYVEGSFAA